MYYGQWETDRIIESYFPDEVGSCIEVGAYDGIKGSNSKLFENKGWHCLCIEPNPYIYPELLKNRPKSACMCVACSDLTHMSHLTVYNFKSGVQSSLTSLDTDKRLIEDYANAIESTELLHVPSFRMDELNSNLNVDFISIDTEGTELNVLFGINLKENRPKLLVVENNYNDDYFRQFLTKYHHYTLDQRYKVNDFYLRNEE